VGVDVGTGSARAAVFNTAGCKLGYNSHPISLANPAPGHYEQSSREVWEAVGEAVRGALAAGAVDPAHVRGIGFDATCSLVVAGSEDKVGVPSDPRTAQRACVSAGVGGDGEHGKFSFLLWLALPGSLALAWHWLPADLSVVALQSLDNPRSHITESCAWAHAATDGDTERDIIVWMDHRAEAEAVEANATQHRVLAFVGGRISPEMQVCVCVCVCACACVCAGTVAHVGLQLLRSLHPWFVCSTCLPLFPSPFAGPQANVAEAKPARAPLGRLSLLLRPVRLAGVGVDGLSR
jgi:hypothetical protein